VFMLLLQFLVHLVVGSLIFATIAAFALSMRWMSSLLTLPAAISAILRAIEYGIFALDALLLLIFILRTGFSLVRSLLSLDRENAGREA
jgi:hypothetical protein